MKVENGMAIHGREGTLVGGTGGWGVSARLLCAQRPQPRVLYFVISGISTLEISRWTLVLVI